MGVVTNSQKSGFVSHCSTYVLEVNGDTKGYFTGDCADDLTMGDYHYTDIDLNRCLVNIGGVISPQAE